MMNAVEDALEAAREGFAVQSDAELLGREVEHLREREVWLTKILETYEGLTAADLDDVPIELFGVIEGARTALSNS